MSAGDVAPTSHSYFSQRLRLHYLDWGNADAPPLLLVHGNRDHCHNWDWVARELREEYHIIAPDFRGHGDSQWVHGSGYNLNEFVYDLAQLIHQQKLAPLRVVAHSLGGVVALRYAGAYPENIEKLVVIEGTGGPPGGDVEQPHERLRNWIDGARSIAGRMPKRYASLQEAWNRMHEANNHLRVDQAEHLTIHGADQNEDGTYSWKFDNYTHVMAPFDMTREQTRSLWGRITSPVLLIQGAESTMTENAEKEPEQFFQNATRVMVDNAGHWVQHDQLAEFVRLTRGFLAA